MGDGRGRSHRHANGQTWELRFQVKDAVYWVTVWFGKTASARDRAAIASVVSYPQQPLACSWSAAAGITAAAAAVSVSTAGADSKTQYETWFLRASEVVARLAGAVRRRL